MQAEALSAEYVELESLSRKIEQWRQRRPKTRPMPQELWEEASWIAQKLGIFRVSRALRLSYAALKGHVIAGRPHRRKSREVEGAGRLEQGERTDFIELSGLSKLSAAPAHDEAVVEVVAGDGTRLTIRLKGAVSPNVAALVSAFRGRS